MDRLLCGQTKESVSIVIGGVHAVLFFGLFLWKLAVSIAEMIEYSTRDDIIIWILVNDMTNSEVLMGCIFSLALIFGIRKRLPGLVLTWMMSQVVFIICSLLAVLYFLCAPYLKITVLEVFAELAIDGVLSLALYVVYSHFEEMRKGNLLNEEEA